MKAIFVYRYLTPGGGCEAVMKARLKGLPALGVEAHAWFLLDLGGQGLFADVQEQVHVGSVEQLAAFIDRLCPDVVTTIDTDEVLPLFSGGRRSPVLVIEAHSTYWDGLDYLKRLADFPVTRIITPSRAHAEALAAHGQVHCPISVVPNPVRCEFLTEPAESGARPRRPCIGWVGRLDDLKNWQDALAVASKLAEGGHDVELWLAGKAVESAADDELRLAALRLGLLPRLRWFRGLPYAAMPAFFDLVRDSGGAVLSTSRAESFGLAIAEGMARGCAVVVPDLPAFRDLVSDGASGVLYSAGHAWKAAEALDAVLSDGERRAALGQSGRAAILERLSPQATLPTLVEALRASARP